MTFPVLNHEQDYAIKGIMEDVNNDDPFGDVVEKIEWHSGGGLFHLLWRMTDNTVFAFHFQDSLLELSWDKWDSLQAYLDAPETLGEVGFGFEVERPNYDTRHWDIDGDKEVVMDFCFSVKRSALSTWFPGQAYREAIQKRLDSMTDVELEEACGEVDG